MVLHESIALRNSPTHGKGLVATRLIPKGTRIWWEDQNDFFRSMRRKAEIETWPENKRRMYYHFGYQIDDDLYVSESSLNWNSNDDPIFNKDPVDTNFDDASNYMNHSCDPNVWYERSALEMTARRDIAEGEEVVMDYATGPIREEMAGCRCGTAVCRGKVTPEDYKRKDLQERYGPDHVMPFLAKKIWPHVAVDKFRLV